MSSEEGRSKCHQAWLVSDENEVWVKSFPGDLRRFEVKRNTWKEKGGKIDQVHGIDSSLAIEDRWVWCGEWKKFYRVDLKTLELRDWGMRLFSQKWENLIH